MRTALYSISIRLFDAENDSLWLAESVTRIAKNNFKSTAGKDAERKKEFQILICADKSHKNGQALKTPCARSQTRHFFSNFLGRGEKLIRLLLGGSSWLNVTELCGYELP